MDAAPPLIPADRIVDEPLLAIDPQNPVEDAKVEPTDLTMEAATEMILATHPVRAIMDTVENLHEGMIEAAEMVELFDSARAVKVVEPPG